MAEMEKLSKEVLEQVSGGTLTKEEALEKALKHSKLKKEEIDLLKKIELDHEHGRLIYEIKFYKDGFEYEYDVDAASGKILKFEKDFDD